MSKVIITQHYILLFLETKLMTKLMQIKAILSPTFQDSINFIKFLIFSVFRLATWQREVPASKVESSSAELRENRDILDQSRYKEDPEFGDCYYQELFQFQLHLIFYS